MEPRGDSEVWNHGVTKLDIEYGGVEGAVDQASISENEKDDLLLCQSRRPAAAQSLVRRLLRPQTFFIAGGLGIAVLIVLTTSILVTVRSQTSTNAAKDVHVHHDHERVSTEILNNSSSGLHRSPGGLLTECGETHIEAMENGCIFDEMAFQYTPPACFEAELLAATIDPTSFLAPDAAGIFPWYRWHNFTEPVAQDPAELSKYNYLWTTNDWHITHCLYMWRLTNNAVNRIAAGEKGVYVLEDAIAGGHVSHCNMLVSDKVNPGQTPLRAFRTIGKCVRLDEKEGEKSDLDF